MILTETQLWGYEALDVIEAQEVPLLSVYRMVKQIAEDPTVGPSDGLIRYIAELKGDDASEV